MSDLVRLGDVIKSPKFAYGYYSTSWVGGRLILDKSYVNVGGGGGCSQWTEHLSRTDEDGVVWHAEVRRRLETGAYDEARAEKEYLVTRAEDQSYISQGLRPTEISYGNFVVAVSRDGEKIIFYQGGERGTISDPEIVSRAPLPAAPSWGNHAGEVSS